MAHFVLIPGADGRGWYWHRVAPLLEDLGNSTVSVDLPVSDPTAGIERYVATVLEAIGGRRSDLVLVGQSLGGFIAPIAAAEAQADQIILLNAMVPTPGESAGAWWENTGQGQARADHYAREGLDLPAEFDPIEAFFHDFPPDVFQEAMAMGAQPARFDNLFSEPWPLAGWPDIPTRVLQARDDRFFPLEFQHRVVSERLGIEIEEVPGGHLAALSHPKEVAEKLLAQPA